MKAHLQNIELYCANSNKNLTSDHLSLTELKGLAKATFLCNLEQNADFRTFKPD